MAYFTIYPAIDLHQGRVVRLAQGDLRRETVYGNRPGETARRWLEAGARWLHVVNLDGAFEQSEKANYQALKAILEVAGDCTPAGIVQFGGGLRSIESVEQVLVAGVRRVVLGTAIVEAPQLAREILERFGTQRVAASLDAREGRVMLRGWTEASELAVVEAGRRLAEAGLQTIIFTDVARDGMGSGINLASALELAGHSGLEVIVSGGVRGLEDIRRARQAGLAGVIVGRALYEGTFTLQEGLRLSEDVG